jgi:hypothetical protein
MQVQYSITMAGSYSLRVSFSGIVGAQTPTDLMVQSAATDLTRTYGYGTVLHSAAGVTSSLFVQTRDSYGNNALVDPAQYPLGLEEISFELCKSIEDDPTRACSGGVQEQSVSVTHAYGSGPPGSSDDTAFGLYTLAYFPFIDGTFMPLVRHNSTVVACLFDTSGLPAAVDPGAAEADACILQNQIATASSSNRRIIPNILSLDLQQSSRRLAAAGNVVMVVNATFKEPDLKNAKYWSFLAPILAAVVGVIFDLCCGCIIPSLRSQHKETESTDTLIMENGEGGPQRGSTKDKAVAAAPESTSVSAKETAGEIEDKDLSSLDSIGLRSRDQAGKGFAASPLSSTRIVSGSRDNTGVMSHADNDVALWFENANSNSNLVFLSEQPQEGLPRHAPLSPLESRSHHTRLPIRVSVPEDDQVWSLAPLSSEGSALDPWVSAVPHTKS